MMAMAGVSRKLITKNVNNKQDMPNGPVQAVEEKGKKQRSCEEIQEEHTREIRNHLETGKRVIWHKVLLQVFKELPRPTFLKKRWPLYRAVHLPLHSDDCTQYHQLSAYHHLNHN